MKICIFDQESGYCLGCSRTEEEVIKWKDPETTDEWKKENLIILRKRMGETQLKTFNKSYNEKIEFGKMVYTKELKKEP